MPVNRLVHIFANSNVQTGWMKPCEITATAFRRLSSKSRDRQAHTKLEVRIDLSKKLIASHYKRNPLVYEQLHFDGGNYSRSAIALHA